MGRNEIIEGMSVMKELFYQGMRLEEDFEMIKYLQEVQKNPEALVLEVPEEHLIHEMEYVNNYNHDRRDTGRTHIGYDYHYFTFFYKGFVIYVSSGMFYPFTDENYPGRYNFVLYARVDLCHKRQLTYNIAYEGLHSVDAWLGGKRRRGDFIRKIDRKDLPNQCVHIGVCSEMQRNIKSIVEKYGGYREKNVFKQSPFLLRTGTWSNEHRVVHVVSSVAEPDGHRDSFDCDVVTGCICG